MCVNMISIQIHLRSEYVWVGQELRIHLQQRPLLQNEGRQDYPSEIHTHSDLGQHVHDHTPVGLDTV